MTVHPPHTPSLGLWSPDAYDGLTRDFEERKRRYLSMLVASGSSTVAAERLAQARGYLMTPDDPPPTGPGSRRLRAAAPQAWRDRITVEDRKRADARYGKPYTTSWADDPVVRARDWWQPAIEDISVAAARLTFPPADTFTPPFGPPVTDTTAPQPLKLVVNTVFSFDVVRIDGGLGVRALVEALFTTVENAVPAQLPVAVLDALRAALKEWFDTLHVPVPPGPGPGSTLAGLVGQVDGYDPLQMGRHLGVPLAEAVFAAAAASPAAETRELTDTLAWMAAQAELPFSVALPAVADWVSFGAKPSYVPLSGVWHLSGGDPDFGAPPGSGLPLTARILACAAKDCPPVFRCDTDIAVPVGWSWPTCDATGCYWWRVVLSHSVVHHILRLKDTADFHVTDVLRLVCRHRLYTSAPDPRIPRFVADSVKAALLHFKYWFDEPAAAGEDGGEMTFWSENHQILFHSCELLVGQLFPDDVFPRSGRLRGGDPVTGREHARRGAERARRWLDRRLEHGFSEWCSPGYYNEDFPPLLNLVDFATDPMIATRAAMVLDRLVFDLVRFTTRGSFASSAGRAYFEHKAFGWSQSVGETVELLTGARGDHIGVENTAVALCTSERYAVPEVLLAVARDRDQLDRFDPFTDDSRASLTWQEGAREGITTTRPDDVAFWWGLGGYFTNELRDSTRHVAESHPNLRKSSPMTLLWALDDALPGLLDELGPYMKTLVLDAATSAAALNAAAGMGLAAALLPFPLNLLFGLGSVTSTALALQSLINLIHDIGKMLVTGLEAAWAAITGDDPPEPDIPKSVLQRTLESMLELFNSGNLLGRANLRTFSIADAMLCSVQDHQPGQISFQKQPWIASLGCDVSVWTNAPMTAGGTVGAAGWQFFKHLVLLQGAEAMADVAKLAGLAGMDALKKEGLYEWGGSLCLPRVVQHREAAVIIYNFDDVHRTMSRTPTHAWFPCAFFDEVDPAPTGDAVLPERDGGGTWVFGRNGDGYLGLFSARPVRWVRDTRFDQDPDPSSEATMADAGFTSTELRADDGSNIWVCLIGSTRRHGSFAAFKQSVRDSYLDISGVGTLSSLACELDVPRGVDATAGGFRLDVHDEDDDARVDGRPLALDELPLLSNRYVSGTRPGRVDTGESRYSIRHPSLDLWLEHDIGATRRTASPSQAKGSPAPRAPSVGGAGSRAARFRAARTTGLGQPAQPAQPIAPTTRPGGTDRRRRFDLLPITP